MSDCSRLAQSPRARAVRPHRTASFWACFRVQQLSWPDVNYRESLFMLKRIPCWILLTIVPLLSLGVPAYAQDVQKSVRLRVDLREATKHIFHAKLSIPVTAGPLTLVYPKWIPGEHSPVGPIVNLTGLIFRVD